MLINWRQPSHVYIVCGKTDLRKGIDGLAIVVAENFGMELYDHSLFLFCVYVLADIMKQKQIWIIATTE